MLLSKNFSFQQDDGSVEAEPRMDFLLSSPLMDREYEHGVLDYSSIPMERKY